jgi:hypothetical protein
VDVAKESLLWRRRGWKCGGEARQAGEAPHLHRRSSLVHELEFQGQATSPVAPGSEVQSNSDLP